MKTNNICLVPVRRFPSPSRGKVILGDPGADSGDEEKSKRATSFSGTNQKPERPRPFGTGLVRHGPQGLFWPFFTFLRAIYFSARLDFSSSPISAPGSPRMRQGVYSKQKTTCPCDPRGKHARFVRDKITNLAARRFALSFARNWPMGVRCARFVCARTPIKTVFESVCRIPIVIEASTKRIVYSQWSMTMVYGFLSFFSSSAGSSLVYCLL